MKTLLLAPELFTTDSGIPRILRLYLKALCDLNYGHDAVRFVALNDSPRDIGSVRRYFNPDIVRRWAACTRGKLRFIAATLHLSADVDLIICGHVAQLPVAWLAARLRPGLRYAVVAHGIEVWRPFNLAERIALKGAWRILCVSAHTRDEVLARASIRPERAIVLHNARDPYLDIEPASADTPPPSQPIILTVARLNYLDRYKGVDDLIRALPLVRREMPGARLRVVGRGDDLPRLRELVREHQLDGLVEFLGYVDDAALRDEFARCALFALPSKKEGFGLVFAEAMAHGRPCLGARSGGIPEVITEDVGVLVEYGDVAGIAAACVQALTRRWDRAAILARARRFSFPEFSNQLASVLKS